MYTHILIHIYIYTHRERYRYARAYTHYITYVQHIYIYIHTHVVYVCIYIYIYIHTYIYLHVYIYIYICVYRGPRASPPRPAAQRRRCSPFSFFRPAAPRTDYHHHYDIYIYIYTYIYIYCTYTLPACGASKKVSLVYGFYRRFNNLRFKATQAIDDFSAAHIRCYYVSSDIIQCRLLKLLLDHPMSLLGLRKRTLSSLCF